MIASTVPSAGDSKSKADLSLSSAASFWPLATLVPGTTARLMTVSSLTVAPMEGTGTSMMKVDMNGYLVADHDVQPGVAVNSGGSFFWRNCGGSRTQRTACHT